MACCGRSQNKAIIGNKQVALPVTAAAAPRFQIDLPSGEVVTEDDQGKALSYVAARKLARTRGGRVRERRGK